MVWPLTRFRRVVFIFTLFTFTSDSIFYRSKGFINTRNFAVSNIRGEILCDDSVTLKSLNVELISIRNIMRNYALLLLTARGLSALSHHIWLVGSWAGHIIAAIHFPCYAWPNHAVILECAALNRTKRKKRTGKPEKSVARGLLFCGSTSDNRVYFFSFLLLNFEFLLIIHESHLALVCGAEGRLTNSYCVKHSNDVTVRASAKLTRNSIRIHVIAGILWTEIFFV